MIGMELLHLKKLMAVGAAHRHGYKAKLMALYRVLSMH